MEIKNFYDEEYQASRLEVFERDGRICKICNRQYNDNGLECHHINRNLPQKKLNKVVNLITVCWPCHDYLTELEHKGIIGQAALDDADLWINYNAPNVRYADF